MCCVIIFHIILERKEGIAVRDIVIVGGGAAGLAAAVFCARRVGGERVLLLEKQARVGKKLLATGNGTCNLSNIHADVSHYHTDDPSFVQTVLDGFPPQEAIRFFESIGVRTVVRDNGRVYPLCAQAAAVLDCLREEAQMCGVETRCDTAVTALVPKNNAVTVVTEQERFVAKRVLAAVGGAASASLGGSSEGYGLLTALGHVKTPLFPAIVQIRTEREAVKAVKGIRVDAALTLALDGRTVASCKEELLFADYGLSGPAAMQIGRVAADWERRKKGRLTVSIDLLPDVDAADLKADIRRRATRAGRTLETMLTGLLQKRLGQTVIKAAGLSPLSREVTSLSTAECDRLAETIKCWVLEVTGSAGMNAAQVTAGGLQTAQFDPKTMQSRLAPSVYAVGEVLNVDGDCGGFNLQWAWASAFTAARAMTEELV